MSYVSEEDIKRQLQKIMDTTADEIKQKGVESLFDQEQCIIGGKIILEIDSDMIPTLRFEKEVYPAKRVV